MRDAFKMVLVSLVTSTAVLFGLGETMLRLQSAPPPHWGVVATLPPQMAATKLAGMDGGSAAVQQRYVPNLVGTPLDEARMRWQAQGIGVIEYSQREDESAQIGTILEQIPEPGTILQEREIRVVVARGTHKIDVPDLLGRAQDEARAALLKAGFEVSTPALVPDKERDGVVIQQEPAAGASVPKGTAVKLSIAQRTVEVPVLVGKRLAQAHALLEKAGFQVGQVKTREHPEFSGGRILEQKPSPGESLPRGTTVDLVVVAPD